MNRSFILKFLFILFVSVSLSTCTFDKSLQTVEEPSDKEDVTSTPDIPPEQRAIWAIWESGPHADTYGLEKGPNTYCAKCHSPTNWDYTATIDPPPNCVSCKFASEAEPRIAQGNPLVPEEEWNHIGCEVCHNVSDGVADAGIGWLNPTTGYHETVASVTGLCEKCHLDTQTLRHKRDLGEGVHSTFECTTCHDAHSVKANCINCHSIVMSDTPLATLEHPSAVSNEGCRRCHPQAWDKHDREIRLSGNDNCMACHDELVVDTTQALAQMAHNVAHSAVSCIACHDASGLEVGPIEGQNLWVTFRTVTLLGRSQTEPYQSHNLQRVVDCGRCHYSGNPWGLTDTVFSSP
ncbi:MAG: hypothetical protein AB1345_07620 [Chloroflexota bacterium]